MSDVDSRPCSVQVTLQPCLVFCSAQKKWVRSDSRDFNSTLWVLMKTNPGLFYGAEGAACALPRALCTNARSSGAIRHAAKV